MHMHTVIIYVGQCVGGMGYSIIYTVSGTVKLTPFMIIYGNLHNVDRKRVMIRAFVHAVVSSMQS